MSKLKVGQPAQYNPHPESDQNLMSNNNDGPLAAVIVRVWNEDVGTVNLMVFPDCGSPTCMTSVLPGDGPRTYRLID